MGRMGPALFTVLLPSTDAAQAVVFARRLRERLDSARITHGSEALRIRTSFGVAALGHDTPGSVEDLLKIAAERLEKAAAKSEEQRAAAPFDFGATLQRATGNDVATEQQKLQDKLDKYKYYPVANIGITIGF